MTRASPAAPSLLITSRTALLRFVADVTNWTGFTENLALSGNADRLRFAAAKC